MDRPMVWACVIKVEENVDFPDPAGPLRDNQGEMRNVENGHFMRKEKNPADVGDED